MFIATLLTIVTNVATNGNELSASMQEKLNFVCCLNPPSEITQNYLCPQKMYNFLMYTTYKLLQNNQVNFHLPGKIKNKK